MFKLTKMLASLTGNSFNPLLYNLRQKRHAYYTGCLIVSSLFHPPPPRIFKRLRVSNALWYMMLGQYKVRFDMLDVL